MEWGPVEQGPIVEWESGMGNSSGMGKWNWAQKWNGDQQKNRNSGRTASLLPMKRILNIMCQ